MTAETEQHYLADRDDYLNFANTNYWRSIDKSYSGRFSLKISPVDNQPVPQPQKVSMFRLPIRKGEKWSAKVWAFKALNPGIAGQKIPTTSPLTPKGGISTSKTPPSGVGGLFTLVTPIIIPNLGNQSTENQGLSFNVLAAVPIVKSIFKGLKPVKAPKLKLPEIEDIGDFGTERVGQTNTAYLLVELLDEKNNVINPQYARIDVNLTVTGWQPLNLAEKIEKFQNECTQSGILRFSLVNDTDYNVWFDDFEITHKQSDEKINVTSWTDYYPYGKVAKTSCPANGAYRYGYQGEFTEKEEEWNSFELRQYDSEIGRWLSVDVHGQYWSPYMAMGNDPMNTIDKDGADGILIVDNTTKTIKVKAIYYVTSGLNSDISYSNSEIALLEKNINSMLNAQKYQITQTGDASGQFNGYKVIFELDFIAAKSPKFLQQNHNNIFYAKSFANTFGRSKASNFKTYPDGSIVGAITSSHKYISMNNLYVTWDVLMYMNAIHEIFHTFNFNDVNGGMTDGIMKYPPDMPNQTDINNLLWTLPMVIMDRFYNSPMMDNPIKNPSNNSCDCVFAG